MDRPASRTSPWERIRMSPPRHPEPRVHVGLLPRVGGGTGSVTPAGRTAGAHRSDASIARQALTRYAPAMDPSARSVPAVRPVILDCDPGHDDAIAIAL